MSTIKPITLTKANKPRVSFITLIHPARFFESMQVVAFSLLSLSNPTPHCLIGGSALESLGHMFNKPVLWRVHGRVTKKSDPRISIVLSKGREKR
jgi:hypothetical protein